MRRRLAGPSCPRSKRRLGEGSILRPRSPAAAPGASLYFDDLLHEKVREFNPDYAEALGALAGIFGHLQANIYGNREFLDLPAQPGHLLCPDEGRELNLVLIDYERPERNVYEVTEEFAVHNGSYGNREDVVFLINGIPVLVIECKNASKDEAIALGIDQIRRYHDGDPGDDGAGDGLHSDRGHRFLLWGHLEHGPTQHLQLERSNR